MAIEIASGDLKFPLRTSYCNNGNVIMNISKSVVTFASILMFFLGHSSTANSAWYAKEILHQQAVTKLLKRGDISWGDQTDVNYQFGSVLVSAEGNKVLFTGVCEYCTTGAEVRPFLVNTNGSGLLDLAAMLPPDVVNLWSAWRNLAINDDASKIFFRAYVETGDYDDQRIYVYDVASSSRSLAVNQSDLEGEADNTGWRFRINEEGSGVYLDKLTAYYPPDDDTIKGLFYAPTGGTKSPYLDINTLDCAPDPYLYCGYMNLFQLLGVSARNDLAFFSWDSEFTGNGNIDPTTGFWYTGLDGNAVMLSEEHVGVSNGDPRGISNADGSKAIYKYRHDYPDILRLAVVNVPSGSENVVGWTSGLNGFDAHMTRSGRYVLTRGEYGDYGTYYQTMIDLQTGTSRDTWSYYLPSMWGSTSNITENDRYYFYSLDHWPNDSEAVAGLYRIDMQTKGDAQAPYVHEIAFDAPALLDYDDVTISVRVTITDLQGIGNIDWVRLTPLVEGQEEPAWAMGREPLAFPEGDPGSTLLYDDGTNGDVTAGDGIFSFDSIATRKGDRQEGGFNTWYQHYALPAPVGIRIIVKDNDNNYTIADTQLVISKIHVEPDALSLEIGEAATVSITGAEPPYTVTADKPGIVSFSSAGDVITVTGLRAGNAILTIMDNAGNQATVTVTISGNNASFVPLLYMLLDKEE
jgi:hypothetical protein